MLKIHSYIEIHESNGCIHNERIKSQATQTSISKRWRSWKPTTEQGPKIIVSKDLPINRPSLQANVL